MKMMEIVAPVALGIQGEIITKYGFSADQMGAMQFSQAIRAHEPDADIAAMATALKKRFMP